MANEMNQIYDVAIVGTGPAGFAAALNFKLHGKSILWFGSKELSDKVAKAEMIANYPGLTRISGAEFNQNMKRQIEEEGFEITEKMVTNIAFAGSGYMLLADNEVYNAKTVLLATGAVAGKGFEGETEFLGRGVSYCATCDGFLYKDKVIAVFCGAKQYEHEVEYLAEIAAKVYLFAGYPECEIHLPNVEKMDARIHAISGEMRAEKIALSDGRMLDIDGLFVLRTSVAPTTLINGLMMDGSHIAVDSKYKTNMDGVYAAGDCTGSPYQITVAMGEGNAAAHAMLTYLSELDKA